jgi:hypothetical protein
MTNNEAIDLVKRFLQTMEVRDLATAEAMMAPGARITFPGGIQFTSQRQMVEASQERYQWIKKTFDEWDTFTSGESQVVYVRGFLYGVNCHGVPFSNIRYIDRFVIQNNLVIQQDVWNDLAESGVLNRTKAHDEEIC